MGSSCLHKGEKWNYFRTGDNRPLGKEYSSCFFYKGGSCNSNRAQSISKRKIGCKEVHFEI
jgi:hypothetical protein